MTAAPARPPLCDEAAAPTATPSTPVAPAERLLRIGELAERSGRTERTLRFYEELGLLTPVSRTKGGFRLYDDNALLRIDWITRLQDLGFSLPEVKEFLLHLHARPSAPAMMENLREFYATKLTETRAAIERLRALDTELSTALSYLSTCRSCAPTTVKTACRSCADDDHVGHTAPSMVAAVHPLSPESR